MISSSIIKSIMYPPDRVRQTTAVGYFSSAYFSFWGNEGRGEEEVKKGGREQAGTAQRQGVGPTGAWVQAPVQGLGAAATSKRKQNRSQEKMLTCSTPKKSYF